MDTLISKMSGRTRKTWEKVRKSFYMDNTDEDYKQWRDETINILYAGGEEAFSDICNRDDIDESDMEDLLFFQPLNKN